MQTVRNDRRGEYARLHQDSHFISENWEYNDCTTINEIWD